MQAKHIARGQARRYINWGQFSNIIRSIIIIENHNNNDNTNNNNNNNNNIKNANTNANNSRLAIDAPRLARGQARRYIV